MPNYPTWRITDFDVSEKRKQFYRDLDKVRMAMGNEMTEDDRPHLQVFITFTRGMSFKAMQKLLKTAHFEKCKVSDWNYELKEMNYEIDDRRKQGSRNDLLDIKEIYDKNKSIRSVYKERGILNNQQVKALENYAKYCDDGLRDEVKVYWVYGESGIGKTRSIWECEKDIFVPVSWKWWDGYDGHEVVLIDDIRNEHWPFSWLLKILDRYPVKVETKGGSTWLKAKRIYITCDVPPEVEYKTSRGIIQLLRRITDIVFLKGEGKEVE